MKLYIKYMVSLRCKMVVQDALEALKIKYFPLEPGLVETCEKPVVKNESSLLQF